MLPPPTLHGWEDAHVRSVRASFARLYHLATSTHEEALKLVALIGAQKEYGSVVADSGKVAEWSRERFRELGLSLDEIPQLWWERRRAWAGRGSR